MSQNSRVRAATQSYRYKRLLLSLARSVVARSVNSPQVNKFLQVYHCSGDSGSTKVIIFYAILVCLCKRFVTRLYSISSLIIVYLRFKACDKVKLYTTSFYRYLWIDLKFFPFTFVVLKRVWPFYVPLFSQALFCNLFVSFILVLAVFIEFLKSFIKQQFVNPTFYQITGAIASVSS